MVSEVENQYLLKIVLDTTQNRPAYIATAIPFDDEMKERVKIHQIRRENIFENYEEPEDITKVLTNLRNQTVLVDCLTINLSNIILKSEDLPLSHFIEVIDDYVESINAIAISNNPKYYHG